MELVKDSPPRCGWARAPEERVYHDNEWGLPVLDDRVHFEFLVLESAQAGLSWLTVLRRREGYREAFADFDPLRVAEFDSADVTRLMSNERIVRNLKKIESAIGNARAFLDLQKEYGSFNNYIWGFVNGKVIDGQRASHSDVPPSTELSDRLARELKSRGFRFLGSTILYAYMQAVGMVNDHLRDCFRYEACKQAARELGLA